MTQSQHLLAGVRAATQRYYGSPRKRVSRQIYRVQRTLAKVVHKFAALSKSLMEFNDRLVARERQQLLALLDTRLSDLKLQGIDDDVVLSAAMVHRCRHPNLLDTASK